MSTARRIVLATMAVAGWTGLGCLLWALVAPSQDRLLEMRKNEAKEHPARMAEMRQQNELILKVLKEAAETTENVASKPTWNSR
ncbi:ubiquinol-cytochrome-c reductase complex assembly factor 3 [Gastrophryne carolinensis]